MQIHLVDATYELFRAHYAPRPPVLGRDGVVLVGRVRAVRPAPVPAPRARARRTSAARRTASSSRSGTTSSRATSRRAGMPPELLDQFPIAEQAIEALGIVLWPMVEFEADDAIAAAAGRFAADPAVERILICTPDKDMAQLVDDDRVVLWDRRRQPVLRRRRRPREVGRRAGLDPRLAGPRRRLGRRLPGAARLGREVGRRGPRGLRLDRGDPAAGEQVGGARACAARPVLAATLRDQLGRRDPLPIARPAPDADDGVAIPQASRGRARVARRAASDLGGVLRRVGPGAASGPAAPLAGRVGAASLASARSAAWCAGGRGDERRRSAPSGRGRTSGPPSIAVTVAPARSAISPAAATSQVDSPPCWTNASNRPFAT